MKIYNFLPLAIMLPFFFTSCEKIKGEGPVISETRTVNQFSGIELNIHATINFTQGPNQMLELKGQSNMLNILETYVAGSNLVIKFRNDIKIGKHEPITINISAPDLNNIVINGSGKIITTGNLANNESKLQVNGSGNIEIKQLNVLKLDAVIAGSGDIKIVQGTANEERLKIIGSGNFYLGDILAKDVHTHISGSGNTEVNVTDNLNVVIEGSGNVYYKGQPQQVNTTITGSGKVLRL